MKFSVIIPMYNEKANAQNCASELTSTLEKAAEALSFEYEIIFSDDGSRDGCGDLVREWIDKNDIVNLPLWEGDKIFLDLINKDVPFFSLKLVYEGERLVSHTLEY
jgi:glycosyltransferase involved in cell wall biosynthesis